MSSSMQSICSPILNNGNYLPLRSAGQNPRCKTTEVALMVLACLSIGLSIASFSLGWSIPIGNVILPAGVIPIVVTLFAAGGVIYIRVSKQPSSPSNQAPPLVNPSPVQRQTRERPARSTPASKPVGQNADYREFLDAVLNNSADRAKNEMDKLKQKEITLIGAKEVIARMKQTKKGVLRNANYNTLLQLYIKLKDRKSAEEVYTQMQEDKPSDYLNLITQRNLIDLYVMEGDLDQALQIFKGQFEPLEVKSENNQWMVDLHERSHGEAFIGLHHLLSQDVLLPLVVITGKGNHSKQGAPMHAMRDYVLERLEKHHQYLTTTIDEQNSGRIHIGSVV